MTSALYHDPQAGPTVLHFAVPLKSPGVKVLDNWRTMGMRASGSNDIVLDGLFVPEVRFRTSAKGKWEPFFNVIAVIALPLLMSVYLGVAEAARDLALQQVSAKRDDADVWYLVGEMENALVTGQMAVQGMIELCADYAFAPDIATANALFIRKTIAAQSLLSPSRRHWRWSAGAVCSAAWVWSAWCATCTGPSSTPCRAKRQHRFTGRAALGLDPAGSYRFDWDSACAERRRESRWRRLCSNTATSCGSGSGKTNSSKSSSRNRPTRSCPGVDRCPRRTRCDREARHEHPTDRCRVAAEPAGFVVQQLNAFAREPHDFVHRRLFAGHLAEVRALRRPRVSKARRDFDHALSASGDEQPWPWLLNRSRRQTSVLHLIKAPLVGGYRPAQESVHDLDRLDEAVYALGERPRLTAAGEPPVIVRRTRPETKLEASIGDSIDGHGGPRQDRRISVNHVADHRSELDAACAGSQGSQQRPGFQPRASRIPWEHEVIGDPCGVESHRFVARYLLDHAVPIVLAEEGYAEAQRTGAHGRISYSALKGLSIGTRRTLLKPNIQAQLTQSGLR